MLPGGGSEIQVTDEPRAVETICAVDMARAVKNVPAAS
jgi:hypothetical protein